MAGLGAVIAGIGLSDPATLLVGLVLATAGLLQRWLSWDLAVPAGVLGLLSISTIVGTIADVAHVNLLRAPWLLAGCYLTYAVGAVLVATRPSQVLMTTSVRAGRWQVLAFAPFAVAAGIGLAQAFVSRMPPSWAFASTDFAQHLLLLRDVQAAGALDYSVSGYPRGPHMLAALVSVPGAPLSDARALLGYDLRLWACITWLSLALLLWTSASLALRLGRLLHLRPQLSAIAAALFGTLLLLTNTLVALFVSMGAAASLLAVVVIWHLPLAALSLRSPRARGIAAPILATIAVMLLAHLWQTFVVVPPFALSVYALPKLRPGWLIATSAWHSKERWWLLCLPLLILAVLVVAAIPMLSIQRGGGASLAATPGTIPSAPWATLVLGLLVVVVLLRHFRQGWYRLLAGSVAGLLLATAVMLRGAGRGFDLTQYYPMKVLWVLTIALGPILALVGLSTGQRLLRPVWSRFGRLGPVTFVARAGLVALTAALVLAYGLSYLLGTGSNVMSTLRTDIPHGYLHRTDQSDNRLSRERMDVARDFATAFSPALTVPIAVGSSWGNLYGPYVISKLISFETRQPQNLGNVASICAEVRTVAGSREAVVITEADPDILRTSMTRGGCAGVRVVQIPGGAVAEMATDLTSPASASARAAGRAGR